jgi:hypothetical protein
MVFGIAITTCIPISTSIPIRTSKQRLVSEGKLR